MLDFEFSKMNLENCIDIKIGKTSDDYPLWIGFEESNLNFYLYIKLRFKSKM